MFNRKPKKSSKTPQRDTALGIAANIVLGPLGFRAKLSLEDEDPKPSQISFHSQRGDDSGLPPPEPASTPVDRADRQSTENQDEPTGDDIGEIGEEETEPPVATSGDNEEDHKVGIPTTPAEETAVGFSSLRTTLEAISPASADPKETIARRNKVENLLHHIAALDERFAATRPDGVEDQRNQRELIGKLNGIEGRLRSLHESQGLQQCADGIQGGDNLGGVLWDLQEAIFGYQSVYRTILQEEGYEQMDQDDSSTLNGFRSAQEGEYRHGGRKSCLRGTRSAVLDEIELWTRDPDKPPIYWLNGLAGTGKSTIAQTIAERLFADGRLGASFFCSRDFEDRSDLRFIFPTLAIQLAQRYPQFRSNFTALVRSDPKVAYESLYNQMNKLIVRPLLKSAISTVIVIDALDECKDEEPASAILSVLGQFVSKITSVKFFLTGRPERRILGGFRLPLLAQVTDVFVLHEVEPDQVDSDIRLFFKHKLSELVGYRRGRDAWPSNEQLDLLCERARGLFIYAVATVRFVNHKAISPKKQLNRLLESPGNSSFEGRTTLNADKTLDSLYTSILQEAFTGGDLEYDPMIRSLLGAVVLAVNPLSPSAIATLLSFDIEDVFPPLSSIHSLLHLDDEDPRRPVRPLHKSFTDFIVDPARCTNPRFHVRSPGHHTELLSGCLDILNRKLERNMCKLPDAVVNSEVKDLKERVERYIDHALQYACRSWHKHLIETIPARKPDITSALHEFLERNFLFWLEVMSVLGAAREAIDALKAAAKWLDVSSTLELVNDYLHFSIKFFEVIDASAPHIYHSALLLSPRTSMVRKLYQSYARPFARVVRGLPTSWEPPTGSWYSGFPAAIAWSPCGRFIAFTTRDSEMVEILDAITLGRIKTLEAPSYITEHLSFSSDGRILTGFGEKLEFTSWDLQTGGVVCTISSEARDTGYFSSTHSIDGKVVAVAYTTSFGSNVISIYNLTSKTHIYSHLSEERIVAPVLTHGERLRFASVKPGYITTWETGFASIDTLTKVGTLRVPAEVEHAGEIFYLPTLSRLAFTLPGAVLVWDTQNSKFLLDSRGYESQFGTMVFSPDGRFFAFKAANRATLFKESPTGYTVHQELSLGEVRTLGLVFSPDGESIAMYFPMLQLWRTEGPPPSLTQLQSIRSFLLDFSPDGSLAALSRLRERTVTILDIGSGEPRSIIDTGLDILCLRMNESVIMVVCDGGVLTWDLPGGDCAFNTRANIDDSVRTTTVDFAWHEDLEALFASISPNLDRIAVARGDGLDIYDASTGEHLTGAESDEVGPPFFAPDGCQVWLVVDPDFAHTPSHGYSIVGGEESDSIQLEPVGPHDLPSEVPGPWESSHGMVVYGEWVQIPGGKRLLWLPRDWRLPKLCRVWGGRLLGFWYPLLPEVVILEFFE